MPDGRDTSGMRLAGIGLELIAVVGAMMLLGWWIDRHFGTAPWALLVGAMVGLVGGMYNLVREALGATRQSAARPGSKEAGAEEAGPRQEAAEPARPDEPGSGERGV